MSNAITKTVDNLPAARVKAGIEKRLDSLPQCAEHYLTSKLNSGASQTIGNPNFDPPIVGPEEWEAIQKVIASLETITSPPADTQENRARKIHHVTEMLSAYPFGVRFDHDAMRYKIGAFVKALRDQPAWAVEAAAEKRIKDDGPEPSAGQFLGSVKAQTNRYRLQILFLKKIKKKEEGE